MALKSCVVCGRVGPTSRCPRHTRGTTAERGYDAEHDTEREAWAPHVEAGEVDCRRGEDCVSPTLRIQPGEPWDLGHPDHQCRAPRAPEHRLCNRGATRRT